MNRTGHFYLRKPPWKSIKAEGSINVQLDSPASSYIFEDGGKFSCIESIPIFLWIVLSYHTTNNWLCGVISWLNRTMRWPWVACIVPYLSFTLDVIIPNWVQNGFHMIYIKIIPFFFDLTNISVKKIYIYIYIVNTTFKKNKSPKRWSL